MNSTIKYVRRTTFTNQITPVSEAYARNHMTDIIKQCETAERNQSPTIVNNSITVINTLLCAFIYIIKFCFKHRKTTA